MKRKLHMRMHAKSFCKDVSELRVGVHERGSIHTARNAVTVTPRGGVTYSAPPALTSEAKRRAEAASERLREQGIV